MTPAELAAYRTVVLEGCDGTGKTTLARALESAHAFTVIHSPRTPDHVGLAARYRDILRLPGRLALDRAFVSELVYGPLLRGRSRLTWDETFDLVDAVARRDGILVHLTGTAETVHDRLISRDGTSAASVAELADLIIAYRRVFATLAEHGPVTSIDIDAA